MLALLSVTLTLTSCGGDDTSIPYSVSSSTNSGTMEWKATTDGTYGSGFTTTMQGLKIGYFKHTSNSSPVAPNVNHVRIYKNTVLSIASMEGKTIKKIVISCAPSEGSSSYCYDMTGLEGCADAKADYPTNTVTWYGSANRVVLQANNGQVRMENISVELE